MLVQSAFLTNPKPTCKYFIKLFSLNADHADQQEIMNNVGDTPSLFARADKLVCCRYGIVLSQLTFSPFGKDNYKALKNVIWQSRYLH